MMDFLTKQAELTRTLFEINMTTAQEIFQHQQEDLKKYFELNSDYSGKLPGVQDYSGLVELQRSYGEALWNGVRESGKAQAEIVRSAVEEAGDAVRSAFNANVETAQDVAGDAA